MLQSHNIPQMGQNTVFYYALRRKRAVHDKTLSQTTGLIVLM